MNINWGTLGFHYTEPDYIVRAACHDGVWEKPYATKDKFLHLHVSATCLQYGQEAFEGLKAFLGIDGKIRIFRWEENAKRVKCFYIKLPVTSVTSVTDVYIKSLSSLS